MAQTQNDDILGVILAGGTGSRLMPLTSVTNKHLLPVYDRPMIHYVIQSLTICGVREIAVVTGGAFAGEVERVLGNGAEFGCAFKYARQEGVGGIADALLRAEAIASGRRVCVVLGDNIFERSFAPSLGRFRRQVGGARVLLKETADPRRYGVARLENGRIAEIVEKPDDPPSNLAVPGVYMYNADVFDVIRTLRPSARGEFEISGVNDHYARRGTLEHDLHPGWWIDAGTFDSLLDAGNRVRESGVNLLELPPRLDTGRLA